MKPRLLAIRAHSPVPSSHSSTARFPSAATNQVSCDSPIPWSRGDIAPSSNPAFSLNSSTSTATTVPSSTESPSAAASNMAIRFASATPSSSFSCTKAKWFLKIKSACLTSLGSPHNHDSISHPAALPKFGVEVGRMARDLAALFRISNVINSIRESELLQREVLRLIFEVIPAENGAVILLTDVDEDWARSAPGVDSLALKRSSFNASSFTAQSGSAPPFSPTMRQTRAKPRTSSACRS